MTTVEDYSEEGLACITSILESRVERIGQCHITTKGISKILVERFGLASGSVRFLAAHIVGVLERQDKLKLWDIRAGTDVYKVITENVV